MYRRPIVPEDFIVPLKLETPEFRLRPLTINDVVKDYDAVMTSAEHLRTIFGDGTDWPANLTFEDNLIDLGWHHREFTIRHSFAYTVMSLDESRCLGCCYIYPAKDPADGVEAFYWARQSELASGLEDRLGKAFRDWLARDWPFKRVTFPGR
jgi:hypothetical protein